MKYYFCTIQECNGEYTYDTNFVMASDNIAKDFAKTCQGFRNYDGYEDDEEEEKDNLDVDLGLIFDSNGACIDLNDSAYREIPGEDFLLLAKYIADLTVG